MKHLTRLTLAATLGASLLPGVALADNPGNGAAKWKKDKPRSEYVIRGAQQDYRACPPGLAKKNNGCRPPGLTQKHHERKRWREGERITGDYILVRDPRRFGLDPRNTYWRSDGYVYRVDRKTGEVLALIGLAQSILGN
ncbi:excinuclease ABC subunit A [Thioclava marina]|uniref:excinuclease ABC subunit A n=1 Tax=Thioclava marina TaxID=1915077 RepID=UPI0023562303|nr:excinuclease ABC subunit A [Thioclava marina]